MPAELIAPALASGNTVVWTPASSTAVAAVALAQCVAEAALPQGRDRVLPLAAAGDGRDDLVGKPRRPGRGGTLLVEDDDDPLDLRRCGNRIERPGQEGPATEQRIDLVDPVHPA